MMDAKLKAKLVEAVEKAYEQRQRPLTIEDRRLARSAKILCRNRVFILPKRQSPQPQVYATVITNLVNARVWGAIERGLAEEAVERMVGEFVRRRERSGEDPAQLSLPGFDFLPKRVRLNRQTLAFGRITVAQFLRYKKWYESRWETDQQLLGDLKRLAEKLERFAKEDPQLTVAEALRRAEPPALAIVR